MASLHSCPNCRSDMVYVTHERGRELAGCPGCGHVLTVSRVGAEADAVDGAEHSPAPTENGAGPISDTLKLG